MMNLEEFRAKNPAYANTPAGQLAYGIWNKFYREKMPMGLFADQANLSDEDFDLMVKTAESGGYQPTTRGTAEGYVPEGAEAATFLQGQTFGWGGEALSGIMAAKDKMVGAIEGNDVDFGKAYEDYNQRYDQMIEDYKRARPGEAAAVEVGGALLSPIGLAKAPAVVANAPPAVRAAVTGGTAGSAYAAGTAEEGKRLEAAQDAFVPSMLFGLGTQQAFRGVGAGFNAANRAFRKKPGVDSLRRVKEEAYKAVDQRGDLFGVQDMQQLLMRSSKVAEDLDYDPLVNKYVAAAQRLLEKKQGQTHTLGQLDRLRRRMWDLRSSAPNDEKIILRGIIDEIDNLIDNVPVTGDLMRAARQANSNFRKAELLDDAFMQAKDAAAVSGSGGNIANQYRQAVKRILNNKRESKWFSPEELETMRAFARGNFGDNFLRWLGKLSPTGNGLMMALHAFGAAVNPATLGIAGTGFAAKAASDYRTKRGAEALVNIVGGLPQAPSVPYIPGVSQAGGLLSQQ